MDAEQTKRVQEFAQAELERLMRTADQVAAKTSNSYRFDGAYVGALVQTLAAIELSHQRK